MRDERFNIGSSPQVRIDRTEINAKKVTMYCLLIMYTNLHDIFKP